MNVSCIPELQLERLSCQQWLRCKNSAGNIGLSARDALSKVEYIFSFSATVKMRDKTLNYYWKSCSFILEEQRRLDE